MSDLDENIKQQIKDALKEQYPNSDSLDIGEVTAGGVNLGEAMKGGALATMANELYEQVIPLRCRWLRWLDRFLLWQPWQKLRNLWLKWANKHREMPKFAFNIACSYVFSKYGENILGKDGAKLAGILMASNAIQDLMPDISDKLREITDKKEEA